MSERLKNRGTRAALAKAMRELVAQEGDQTRAGKRVGLAQSGVSAVLNMRRAVEIDTLVRLRNALGKPLDEILNLPALGPLSEAAMPLGDIVKLYPGRWPQELVRSLAAREGTPKAGWKVLLDDLAEAWQRNLGSVEGEELAASLEGTGPKRGGRAAKPKRSRNDSGVRSARGKAP